MVGRLSGGERGAIRRLPTSAVSLSGPPPDLGSLSIPLPSEGELYRVVCECVCDNNHSETGSPLAQENGRTAGPTTSQDYLRGGVPIEWVYNYLEGPEYDLYPTDEGSDSGDSTSGADFSALNFRYEDY